MNKKQDKAFLKKPPKNHTKSLIVTVCYSKKFMTIKLIFKKLISILDISFSCVYLLHQFKLITK